MEVLRKIQRQTCVCVKGRKLNTREQKKAWQFPWHWIMSGCSDLKKSLVIVSSTATPWLISIPDLYLFFSQPQMEMFVKHFDRSTKGCIALWWTGTCVIVTHHPFPIEHQDAYHAHYLSSHFVKHASQQIELFCVPPQYLTFNNKKKKTFIKHFSYYFSCLVMETVSRFASSSN